MALREKNIKEVKNTFIGIRATGDSSGVWNLSSSRRQYDDGDDP